MSRIVPIPTTRVGDFFIRQRLSDQIHSDQLDLFKLQNQVSTGQRLQVPSDDASAALRAINLQRLLSRKGQIQTNLQSSNFYLNSAANALSSLSGKLAELRGEVIGSASTVTPESERQAAIQTIDGTLRDLIATANSKAQGRYLFSGSRTSQPPYSYHGEYIEYNGNDQDINSYVDLRRLFETNLPGSEVFGGISTPVEGTADLNPQLSGTTLLSTINSGAGVSRNAAITLRTVVGSDPAATTIVDLSKAVNVGEVARMIEEAAPASAGITVDISGNGLVIRSSSGTLSVDEVAQGRAAHELGIYTGAAVPASTVTGTDLDPAVIKTTRLSDLLGTKAQGRIVSLNPNNNLVLSANVNGTALNGVTVRYVAGAAAGSEVASYDSNTNTLTVQIEDGVSSASQVAAAINTQGAFTATLDYRDATSSTQAGTSPVAVANFGVITAGGSGQPLDTTSGLVLKNGSSTVQLDISSAHTVEDLLNLVNGLDLGLSAEINTSATGINFRSRWSGADLTIGENGGTTATQLGIRSYTGATKLADFNRGLGVETTSALEQFDTTKMDELRIVARNGVELVVNVSTAMSLQDVVNLINTDPLNTANTRIAASLTANGNGIELADSSDDGSGNITGDLQVRVVGGTKAAEYLGFVAPGATQKSSHLTNTSGNYVMSGRGVMGNDMVITARDGKQLWIDLAGTNTVQDVINVINTNPANNTGTTAVLARLAVNGNGIELVDSSTATTGALTVASVEGSKAAEMLGFLPAGQSQNSDNTADGSGNYSLTSEDRHTLEVDSIFNSLLRLRSALTAGDPPAIGRELERFDQNTSHMTFASAEVGSRLQNLSVIEHRLQDENVQIKSALSDDLDVDLVDAISNLTARQYAFEASLRTAATLLQTTLLNYI